MAVPSPRCGREYDAALFPFGRTLWCACGSTSMPAPSTRVRACGSGWLESGPADLILLTDRNRVVRGLGGFFGGLRPEPVADESFFVAFAPAPSLGEGCEIWAVRGREAHRVVPRLPVPARPAG